MLAKLLTSFETNVDAIWLGAFLLAFGFRRNRFALALAALAIPVLAGAGSHAGLTLGSAILLAAVAIFPEPPVRSWRVGLFGAACVALGFLPQMAPAWLLVLDTAANSAPKFTPILGLASWIVIAAASLVLLRWFRRAMPLDLYFSVALAPAVIALSIAPPHSARAWLSVTAAGFAMAVLYGAFRMAFIDALTGLPNRRALDERLARSAGRISVAMVDVDHFKRFNDRYGHESGDRVLKVVARQLRRCRGGNAFRYGGEEFAIVFEGRKVEGASIALEALRGEIEASRVRLGRISSGKRAQAVRKGQHEGEVGVTVSIGLAERDPEHRSATAVVDAADKALYRSKQRGRNRLTLATNQRVAAR